MQAMVDGHVDAVVYDAPLLQYLASHQYEGKVRILPDIFERQSYAFALPNGSKLREPVNLAMLRVLESPAWRDILYHYLGDKAPK
jgi:ABC-type amino acid transport substrate-binding protein